MTKQYINMDKKIIEKNNKICIIYEYKITEFVKVMKNKGKTINKSYSTVFSKELMEHLEVIDRTIFFYEQDNKVYITSRTPTREHRKIKVQKTKQISIPKDYYPTVEQYTTARFILQLNSYDQYRNKNGLLSMELI